MTLGLPVDRLAERNTFRTALLNLSSAQRSLVDQSEIVKSAVRATAFARFAAPSSTWKSSAAESIWPKTGWNIPPSCFGWGRLVRRSTWSMPKPRLLAAQDAYQQAKSALQINVLQFLQTTGTLRVDPRAGTLGQVLNMTDEDDRIPTNLKNQPLIESNKAVD